MSNKYVIGVTGGIGSGKSTVTAYLRSKGYFVVDADALAREAAMPGEPALLEVQAAFGDGVMNSDGTLNRSALAEIVFSDEAKLETLNSIFHGDVHERMMAKIEEAEAHFVFLDVPLLYETGMDSLCDEVWLVVAPMEDRIARVIARDNSTEDLVRARIDSQMSDEEKIAGGGIMLVNDGTVEELYVKIGKLIDG
jgi:dephospho-CoA kinase